MSHIEQGIFNAQVQLFFVRAKGIINPKAPFTIAKQLLESMGVDNWVDFIVDPETPQGQQQAQAAMQQAQQGQEQAAKEDQVEQQKIMLQLQKHTLI